jgi:hypothetical protein
LATTQSGDKNQLVILLDRDGNDVSQTSFEIDASGQTRPGIRAMDFDAAGGRLAVADAIHVQLFQLDGDVLSPQPIATHTVPMRKIHATCFVSNNRLAITTFEGLIVLLDLGTGKPLRTWHSTKLQHRLLAATPDGKFLLTANGYESDTGPQAESKTVRVWKVDV